MDEHIIIGTISKNENILVPNEKKVAIIIKIKYIFNKN